MDPQEPTKKCCTCHVRKPLSAFNRRRASSDGYQSRCRDCSRIWYLDNRLNHIKNAARRKQRVLNELRHMLACYLREHPCIDCGESDIRCLDFDHVDPSTKVSDVSVMVMKVWSWDRIAAEIAKCVVRCANCHRRKEAERRGLWRQRWLIAQEGEA